MRVHTLSVLSASVALATLTASCGSESAGPEPTRLIAIAAGNG